MDFSELVNRDITIHTAAHKYRGILVAILPRNENSEILAFKMGVDDFFIFSELVIAVTLHGREFGHESVEDEDGTYL